MRTPSAWVDAIVVDPDQQTSHAIPFDPAFSGTLMDGMLFGYARNATAMLDAAWRRCTRMAGRAKCL